MTDEVTISKSEYARLQSENAQLHIAYGDYTDDQIDIIIENKVARETAEWLNKIGLADLEDRIRIGKKQAENAQMAFEEACKSKIELRQTMLETIAALPTATDEEMEKLLRVEE